MTDRARPNDQTGGVGSRRPGERQRQRRLTRPLASAFVAIGVVATLGVPTSIPSSRADSTVIIDGRGFGHGVGMAQDGAYWLGRSGRSAAQILKTFYPGTTLSKRGGAIRVPLAAASTISLRLTGAGSIGEYRIPADTTVSIATRPGGFRITVGGAAPDTTSPPNPDVSNPDVSNPSVPTPGDASASVAVVPAPAPAAVAPAPADVVVPAPAAVVSAPASGGILAAVSPGRFVSQGIRLFRGLLSQGDAATQTGVTVPVVGATTPASVAAPPVVVVTPVDPTSPTSSLADPNTVPVVPAVPPGPVPGASPDAGLTSSPAADGARGSATPVTAAPTASPGTTPPSVEEGASAKPSNFEINGERVEVTSSGLIGMGGRRFRGSLELANRGGSVRVVNIVDVEQYLRGMGEILSRDWPAATLQAQAVAARTYAIRMMGTVGEVCPTQACQVYLGAQVEYPQMDAAVAATRGQVVTYKGALANTFYSASGGGTIADPSEGFGGNISVPYLQAGVYPTGDLKAWTVTMSLGEVARRVGYRGSPSSLAITEVGPSGRAKEVTVYGSSGALRVPGPRFDAALGLRSTFFTFRGTDVGMSPLPVGAGAASAVEVVTAGPSIPLDGAQGGADGAGGVSGELAPTQRQSPFLFDTSVEPGGDVATGSEVAVTETVPPAMTAPTTTSSLPPAPVKTSSAVSVIDDNGTNDAQGPLLVLGGAVALLLGAGVIRRLVVAKRRHH